MAALCEGYTLCVFVPAANRRSSEIKGIEEERDSDHVIVTDSSRSVTLYKVSDQKPLGSWTVKQGQLLTCAAVFNKQTNEYVAVSDNKVIRIWKEDDIILDKAFKATVSADVWSVHCAHRAEPAVLFQRGAVRLLDSLLSAPQQPIEDVLVQDEAIRSRTSVVFTHHTQKRDYHFLYLQRLKPNSVQKYRLEPEEPGLSPLSFWASYRDKNICLLYLYPNGHVYQSLVSVRAPVADDGAQVVPLPRDQLLSLPVGEELLEAASAIFLDDAHVAVVGVPHPSAGPGKDFLCIWNTNFQTLQAAKEMAGKLYGQLWSFSSKLFIPHGKALSVIPFSCPRSSLASALGKLKQSKTSTVVSSWNTILHGEEAAAPKPVESRKTRTTRKTQSSLSLTIDQVQDLIKTAPVEEVEKEVQGLLSRQDPKDPQPSLGQLAMALVSRSLADPKFYSSRALTQLVPTRYLSHSVCPDLLPLALEKRDYFLCQLCLLFFHDIPEAVTCACLKAFISLSDADAEKLSLEPDSVSFMEMLLSNERGQTGLQNGFSPAFCQEDRTDAVDDPKAKAKEKKKASPQQTCPVGKHKAALINEILQTAYSEALLLPHLKDFSSDQVVLFLRYLEFLYLRYSTDGSSQTHGYRSPSLNQVMDWVCMLLDAHFTVLVMSPVAKGLLLNLQPFVKSQVRLFSELGKIEGSLQELSKMKMKKDVGQYSIEVIELY
uniref:Nucleolar protein 11 n=1 Tax=Poecilia reticulata TaxID=8081 RepID=A0A3P9MSI3_POERE